MKTTLKYNTIETFQRQPGWKEYIDAIVDFCKKCFDGMFVGISGYDEYGKPIYSIVEDNPSEHIYNGDLAYAYPIISYKGDNISLNLRENMSLRGLLRTLSLYGCGIDSVEFSGSNLPHTYKTGGDRKDYVYGLVNGVSYEARAGYATNSQGGEGNDFVNEDMVVDYTIEGDSNNSGDDTATEGAFSYERNMYGYNQKNPILSTSPLREVVAVYNDFNCYTQMPFGRNPFNPNWPEIVWIRKSEQNSHAGTIYKSVIDDSGNNNLFVKVDDYKYDIEQMITLVYVYGSAPYGDFKGCVIEESDAFIYNDMDVLDLFVGTKIKYNTSSALNEYSDVAFSKTEADIIQKVDLTNTDSVPGFRIYTDSVYGKQWVVRDSVDEYYKNNPLYIKEQLFSDDCTLSVQPLFIYTDSNSKKVSLCANVVADETSDIKYEIEAYDSKQIRVDGFETLDSPKAAVDISYGDNYYKWNMYESGVTIYERMYPTGNENPQALGWYIYNSNTGTYELTHDTSIQSDNPHQNGWYVRNNSTYPGAPEYIRSGDEVVEPGTNYYKYENDEYILVDTNPPEYYNKVTDSGSYVDDVYTPFLFGKNTRTDITESERYFFNGRDRWIYYGDNENDEMKQVGDYLFKNAHTLEYFETMYFNHFVKVYPIDGVTDNGVVKTKKLYCERLDLVRFGNIEPYVATIDRSTSENLDCTIFSKIISYNENTHLLTVEDDVYFSSDNAYKYVVVAYKNASPFNKINKIRITAPTADIKNTVKPLLESFVNQNCELEIKAETDEVYEKIN